MSTTIEYRNRPAISRVNFQTSTLEEQNTFRNWVRGSMFYTIIALLSAGFAITTNVSNQAANAQEAKQLDRDAPAAGGNLPSGRVVESNVEPRFDLSGLPKLEDLTETTDISAFLRKGVPQNLRNAALRKFWALDPTIRNYVNPALDYAYDWNATGGVPGSSEIGAQLGEGASFAVTNGVTK
jgi:hypothetical protein